MQSQRPGPYRLWHTLVATADGPFSKRSKEFARRLGAVYLTIKMERVIVGTALLSAPERWVNADTIEREGTARSAGETVGEVYESSLASTLDLDKTETL